MVKRRPERLIGQKNRFSQTALDIFTMKNLFFLEHILTRNV
jgi:hypothetical protein